MLTSALSPSRELFLKTGSGSEDITVPLVAIGAKIAAQAPTSRKRLRFTLWASRIIPASFGNWPGRVPRSTTQAEPAQRISAALPRGIQSPRYGGPSASIVTIAPHGCKLASMASLPWRSFGLAMFWANQFLPSWRAERRYWYSAAVDPTAAENCDQLARVSVTSPSSGLSIPGYSDANPCWYPGVRIVSSGLARSGPWGLR